MNRLFAFGCRLMLLGSFTLAVLALVVVGLRFPGGVILVLGYVVWKRYRSWNGTDWAYGSASLGTMLTLAQAGFLSNDHGLVVGRASFTEPPTRRQALGMLLSPFVDSPLAVRMVFAAFLRIGGNSLVRIHNYVHVAVFGSTGSGKGVGVILPNLLSYMNSCVVVDPKAENYRLSAHRRRRMGHKILRLDPFELAGKGSDSLNPLDMIDDKAADFPEQVAALADALIVVTGKEMQPHFPESAKIVLACIIAYVCARESGPENRNLQMVRHILKSRLRFNDAIVTMQQIKTHGGLIAGYGEQLSWYIEKELASIQTTITRFTAWLDTPAMQAITRTSSFDPITIKTRKSTLFLILPSKYLQVLSPLNRMWVSTLLGALTRGLPDDRRQVLFLLDEAGHLGRINILDSAVTLMRGYGIRLMFFFQSIGQVKEVFGDGASQFIDNITTQIYFGINAFESAETISKRCGDATILVESLNDSNSFSRPRNGFSSSASASVSTSRSLNLAAMGRPLIRPDEVLRLSPEAGLLFSGGLSVIPIKLLKYYKEPEFMWGRSGKSRNGVGLFSGLVSAFAFVFSLMLLSVLLVMPQPQRGRAPVAASRGPFSQTPRPNGGTFGQTSPATPSPSRPKAGRTKPPRGGMIRIP